MTNEHALAIAKSELAYYKQVKKDGITIRDWLEFWEIVVDALESNCCEECSNWIGNLTRFIAEQTKNKGEL